MIFHSLYSFLKSNIQQVLRECFRPILGSFKTRLEALYSPQGVATPPHNGSLESICALYEATLQFLSLAYETVAGGWHDVADATATLGSDVYKETCDVFCQLAAPFTAYQKGLGKLEKMHSNISQNLIKKDIQQSVGAITVPSVAVLQDATDKLMSLAPYVFTPAESAMARLELMTGGYQVRRSLSTLDSMVATHAAEMAVAINTLSATFDATKLADNFDDQHVTQALEMLKVAGAFQSSLKEFEMKTHDRMAVLQQRKLSHTMMEKELNEKAKSFMLPDGLSVVEIDSILTYAALEEDDDPDTLARMAGADSVLYPESSDASDRLKRSCQSLVFSICSSVPRKHLADLSSNACWADAASSLDAYGTLPQAYITQVGEHMLALVQALDPFASSEESLAVASQVMSGVSSVALQPWRDLLMAADVTNDSVVESLMTGRDLSEFIQTGYEDDDLGDDTDEGEKAKNAFCNQWLDVVGLAITGLLIERTMRIPRLTTKGCEHLSVDLNYLINVLAALGVSGHPHPLICHIAEISSMEEEVLKEMIQNRDPKSGLSAALRAVEIRFARMRGIKVS